MKSKSKSVPLLQPVPIVIIGTKYKNLVNFTTIGDVMISSISPPLITISLNNKHLGSEIIDQTKILSVNIPSKEMVSDADFCGSVSGNDENKETVFDYTILDDVPHINSSPISLSLRVINQTMIMHRVITTCEVMETYIDDKLLNNGKIELSSIDFLYYGLDNKYYSKQKHIGDGYSEYKKRNKEE